MKRQSKQLIFIGLAFTLCSATSFAQPTIKEITDKFFEIYAKDPAKAIDYGFSTNKWIDIKQDDIVSLKSKLKSLTDLCGEYYSNEFLSEKTAGENVRMMSYIVRYDREPIRFTFLFYKPKDGWRLYNFSYSENLDADMESTKK